MIPPEFHLVRARVGLVSGLVLVALLATLVAVTGTESAVDAYRATHGSGVEGVFTPERQHCSQRHRLFRSSEVCSWRGTFSADDGSVVTVNAPLSDDLGTRRGDSPPPPVHPAYLDDHDGSGIVHRPGDWWQSPLLATLGVVVAGTAMVLRLLRWYRRTSRPAASRHRA